MGIVSYAQNFEDVILWRAFKDLNCGSYIDIGAQDPVVDSVSLSFYDKGWRGFHVEPTQQYSKKLRDARPDEVVFQVAIGNQIGELTFYEFEDTGLSTADIEVANRHRGAGYHANETIVSVISLDALFEKIGLKDIHWLKLDVEGFEKAVLESWKGSTVLPWILVVESTKPMTQEQSHGDWESLLVEKGYIFVYFDGLNRFYVSPEHADLEKFFGIPPNIFDDFELSGTASQPFYKLIERRVLQAEAKALQAESSALQAEATVAAIFASTSWRITRPIRWGASLLKTSLNKSLRVGGKVIRYFPWLAFVLKKIISLFPRLDERIRRIRFANIIQYFNYDENSLTNHELKVLMDIKDASLMSRKKSV